MGVRSFLLTLRTQQRAATDAGGEAARMVGVRGRLEGCRRARRSRLRKACQSEFTTADGLEQSEVLASPMRKARTGRPR